MKVTKSVSLDLELVQWINDQVEAKRYSDFSDAITKAIQRLQGATEANSEGYTADQAHHARVLIEEAIKEGKELLEKANKTGVDA